MARPRNLSPPKYHEKKSRGTAFCEVYREDGTRRQITLGPYGSPQSRRRYGEILESLIAGNVLPEAPDPHCGLTIGPLVAQFLVWAEEYYRKPDGTSTQECPNFVAATRPLLESYGDTAAAEFGPRKLKLVRAEMLRLGWSRTCINKHIVRVRRVFKWGVENELIEPATLHALQAVPGLKRGRTKAPESKKVQPVGWGAVQAVLPFVADQVEAMILLMWYSGMRPGEVVAMRTADIDCSGEVWTYFPFSHKTEYLGRERQIELGPNAIRVLRPWLRGEAAEFMFQPAEAEIERRASARARRKTKVQPSQVERSKKAKPKKHRERYETDTLGRAISRACKLAGIAHWSPNQLRHACATSVRSRYGLEGAQVVLGHAHARVTEIYAERDRQLARRIAFESG